MYNVDDILARLQKGEKLEDIGTELANVMNEAQEKYVAIQKAEEEKKRAESMAKQRAATRKNLLWDLLEAIRAYANYTEYAGVVSKWLDEVSDEDIEDLDAQMLDMLKMIDTLKNLTFNFNTKAPNDTKKVAAVDPNKALGDFIKMMGW